MSCGEGLERALKRLLITVVIVLIAAIVGIVKLITYFMG